MATPKKVTAQEVKTSIDMTAWGEYGADHDWSPSFTLQDKLDALEKLMKNWEHTEPEGKEQIIQFIRALNKEWFDSAHGMTNVVARYSHLPEVVSVVLNECLWSGRFCHDLLVSMKEHRVKQEDWLSRIKMNTAERKFIEKKKVLKRENLYEKIEKLLSEI